MIPEEQAVAGDILVWWGIDAKDVLHSAILTNPVRVPGRKYLGDESELRTKNGIQPEANMTLRTLIDPYYGESYNVYRRK
jgi:hypothetical protein